MIEQQSASDLPLPAIDDKEGVRIPQGLPSVIDAHVHVFPGKIFQAIWSWFEEHAWPIRYQIGSDDIIRHLLDRGLEHLVLLQYAHKPGISINLNQYMLELCSRYPDRVTGLATVFPGEEQDMEILRDAFQKGLKGVKFHAHVQCFDMLSEEMVPIYDICESMNKPMVMHVGREPKSPAYHCDPYDICNAENLESVLRNHPRLKICVPHMGFDEYESYRKLIEKYDTLWLDTAMALTDYIPVARKIDFHSWRVDRIMYGSDFPSIPFAWDRELRVLSAEGLSDEILLNICGGNAREFFDIPTR